MKYFWTYRDWYTTINIKKSSVMDPYKTKELSPTLLFNISSIILITSY